MLMTLLSWPPLRSLIVSQRSRSRAGLDPLPDPLLQRKGVAAPLGLVCRPFAPLPGSTTHSHRATSWPGESGWSTPVEVGGQREAERRGSGGGGAGVRKGIEDGIQVVPGADVDGGAASDERLSEGEESSACRSAGQRAPSGVCKRTWEDCSRRLRSLIVSASRSVTSGGWDAKAFCRGSNCRDASTCGSQKATSSALSHDIAAPSARAGRHLPPSCVPRHQRHHGSEVA
jgi:hypothetical protein